MLEIITQRNKIRRNITLALHFVKMLLELLFSCYTKHLELMRVCDCDYTY